jgi:hypothetical protein
MNQPAPTAAPHPTVQKTLTSAPSGLGVVSRPSPEHPAMTRMRRTRKLDRDPGEVGFRRVSLLTVRRGEGRLVEATAAARPLHSPRSTA